MASPSDERLVRRLVDLGLSEKQAQIYYASLVLGPTTALKLASAAGLKRATVYSVIDSLCQEGLMSVETKGLKRRFVAEAPERLESLLEHRRRSLAEVMPELSALHLDRGDSDLIRHHQGLAAVKGVYEQLLKDARPRDEYLVISDQTRWLEQDPAYFERFSQRRADKRINARLLLEDSPASREHKRYQRNFNNEVKLLPPGVRLEINLVLIPSRVVIQKLVPPVMAFVIENRSVVQLHREMFHIIWNALPDDLPRA